MIEIIKEGDPEKVNPKHYIKCAKCECEFTYQNNDVESDQRDGDYIKCPTCKNYIGI